MLVLSRKQNESIVINNDIVLTVVEIRGDKVRLGVRGPRDCPIHRQEVYDAIHGPREVPPPPPPQPPPPSPEKLAFLAAICAEPEDDTARLIYADWLEERGDPYAEFIRLQCQLAQLPTRDRHHRGLKQREEVLLAEHGPRWRSALPHLLRSQPFVRGFVASVVATPSHFLEDAANIFAVAPLRSWRVQPTWLTDGMDRLGTCPYLARLTTIDLRDCQAGNAAIARLAASPYLDSLHTLILHNNQLTDEGVRALASSPHLPGLAVLDLSGNAIGPGSAQALADSPYLKQLVRLSVSRGLTGAQGMQALRHRFGQQAVVEP